MRSVFLAEQKEEKSAEQKSQSLLNEVSILRNCVYALAESSAGLNPF